MADEWRELALSVPGTLMLVGTSREAIEWLDHTDLKLSLTADLKRMLRHADGAVPDEIEDFVDRAPYGSCPPCMLEKARRLISYHAAVHAMTGHVLSRYGARVGLHRDDPLLRSWDEHHTAALRLADKATEKISAALSTTRAAVDTDAIAEGLAPGTPIWRRWMLATEHLLNRASNEAFLATQLVRRMNHFVALQFFDAWMILKR